MKLDNVCYFFHFFLNYVNFNLIANANNFFIQDLEIDMVWTKGGSTSFRSVNRQGHPCY